MKSVENYAVTALKLLWNCSQFALEDAVKSVENYAVTAVKWLGNCCRKYGEIDKKLVQNCSQTARKQLRFSARSTRPRLEQSRHATLTDTTD